VSGAALVAKRAFLTTFDNPYDPFDDFDNWRAYDEAKGYYSLSYLARVVKSSNELSELHELIIIENAIDEIVKYNPLGIYRKVIDEP